MHSCTICGKPFSRGHDVKRHLKDVHQVPSLITKLPTVQPITHQQHPLPSPQPCQPTPPPPQSYQPTPPRRRRSHINLRHRRRRSHINLRRRRRHKPD